MRIRQIVFADPELKDGVARLRTLLGLAAPYRDPGVAEFGLDNAVFVFGDQFVEIVSRAAISCSSFIIFASFCRRPSGFSDGFMTVGSDLGIGDAGGVEDALHVAEGEEPAEVGVSVGQILLAGE